MKRATKFSLIGLALVMASGTALAGMMGGHHDGGFHGKRGGHEIQRMYHHLLELDLTAEQKTQLKTMMDDAKAQYKAMKHDRKANADQYRAERQAKREQMHSLMMAPNFDEAAARALIAEAQVKRTDMAVEKMKLRHQMLQVLTDEQIAELQAQHEQRMAERSERGGRHHR